jgi:hypothetical protein
LLRIIGPIRRVVVVNVDSPSREKARHQYVPAFPGCPHRGAGSSYQAYAGGKPWREEGESTPSETSWEDPEQIFK